MCNIGTHAFEELVNGLGSSLFMTVILFARRRGLHFDRRALEYGSANMSECVMELLTLGMDVWPLDDNQDEMETDGSASCVRCTTGNCAVLEGVT